MNYAKISNYDIANGLGVRVSLFVSGCTHHCKGCFNPETWNFNYGNPFTLEVEDELIKKLRPSYIKGLSILGGEPFEPNNQLDLVNFIRKVKNTYPYKTIWCYTGYTFETDLLDPTSYIYTDVTREMLNNIDVLVDGEFKEDLKDISLKFRGSSNQRVIDVRESLIQKKTVLFLN